MNNKSGAILAYTIGIVTFLTLFVTSIWGLVQNSLASVNKSREDTLVYQSAENTLNYAFILLDETIKESTVEVFYEKLGLVEAAFGLMPSEISADGETVIIKKLDTNTNTIYQKTLSIQSDGGTEMNNVLFGNNDGNYLLSDIYNYQNLMLQYLYDYSNQTCEAIGCDLASSNQLFNQSTMFYKDKYAVPNAFTDALNYIRDNNSSITSSGSVTKIGPNTTIDDAYLLNNTRTPYYEDTNVNSSSVGDLLTYTSDLNPATYITVDDKNNTGQALSGMLMGSKYSYTYSLIGNTTRINGELRTGKTLYEYYNESYESIKSRFRNEFLAESDVDWDGAYNQKRIEYGYNVETGRYDKDSSGFFSLQYNQLKNQKRDDIYNNSEDYATAPANANAIIKVSGLAYYYAVESDPYSDIYLQAFESVAEYKTFFGLRLAIKNPSQAHEVGTAAYCNAIADDEIARIENQINNEFYVEAASLCDVAAMNYADEETGLLDFFNSLISYDMPVLDDIGNYTYANDGSMITEETILSNLELISYLANIDAHEKYEDDIAYAITNDIRVETYIPFYTKSGNTFSEITFKDSLEYKTIVIKAGSSLFINGDLILGRGAHIVVEDGGMLFVNGDLVFDALYAAGEDESIIPSFTSHALGKTSIGPCIVYGDLIYDVKYHGDLGDGAAGGIVGVGPSELYTIAIGGMNSSGTVGTLHNLEGTFIVLGNAVFKQSGGATPSIISDILGATSLKTWTPVGNIRAMLKATLYVNGSMIVNPTSGSSSQSFGIGFSDTRPSFIFSNNISITGSYKISNLINPISGYAFQISNSAEFGGMISMFVNMFTTEEEMAEELAQKANAPWYTLTVFDRIEQADIEYTESDAMSWGLPKILREGLIVGLIGGPIEAYRDN